MSRSTRSTGTASVGSRRRSAVAASLTAIAVGATLALGAGTAAAGPATPSGPAVTRAAIDPSLTAGRGANVPFVEQEAENATTNGTVIGPSTQAYTLPAEASGR